jgi:hypothetical protein
MLSTTSKNVEDLSLNAFHKRLFDIAEGCVPLIREESPK